MIDDPKPLEDEDELPPSRHAIRPPALNLEQKMQQIATLFETLGNERPRSHEAFPLDKNDPDYKAILDFVRALYELESEKKRKKRMGTASPQEFNPKKSADKVAQLAIMAGATQKGGTTATGNISVETRLAALEKAGLRKKV